MAAPARLSVRLLGDFVLSGDGVTTAKANSPRLQALLAYLILHRDAPQSRQQLAFLFWPDSTEAQARNGLRQLLFQLRKAWPQMERFIRADTNTGQWLPDSPVDLDVMEFQVALAQAEPAARAGDTAAEGDALKRAAELYRGDLLPNCYDDWIVPERDRLREQCIAALERLAQLGEGNRDYTTALRHVQRLQRLDPLREATYVTLMRLHALNKDRAAALRAYHTCVETLARELGVEPSEAVREVYTRLTSQAMPRQRSFEVASPMVGRDDEWCMLMAAWDRASSGHAHFVLISGEPGIGKSRLAEELLLQLSEQGIATARTRAYAAAGRLSFAPVTDCLRSGMIRAAMTRLDKLWLTEVSRLLPELLTQQPDLPAPSPFTEYWQRQRFFEALARAALTSGGPLMLLLDDLQWCDPETLEWLHFLMHFDPRAKLLVVATTRTEEITPRHPLNTLIDALRGDDQLTEISLRALDAAETAKLAAHVSGRSLSDHLATRLFHETEGNPLFVVEMVRAGLSGGAAEQVSTDASTSAPPRPGVSAQLPPKVYSVISNRLAQLSPQAHELAGLAAAVGREFTLDVLAGASDLSEDALAGALDELWQRRIVREAGNASDAGLAYDFSHDKIRDVAYAEVSPWQRRRLHRRVAQALERMHENDLDAVSAQLAAQYEQAGMAAQAASFYCRAAGVAQHIYAYDDAIALLKRGLSQANQIADAHERATQELQLQLDLAPPIRITRGWASPELEIPLQRAWELSQRVGDMNQRARAQISLAFFYEVRAEFAQAHQLGEELFARFRSLSSGTYAVMASSNLTGYMVQTGNWEAGEAEYQRGRYAYDESQHAEHVALMGGDFGVLNAAWSAHALWFMGLADQALQRGHEAEAMANRVAHPFTQALALSYLAMQHVFRREFDLTLSHARLAHDIAERHTVGYYRAWSDVLMCWATAKQAPGANAVAKLQQALLGFRATGGRIRLTLYLGLLAECLGDAGETEAALAAINEALDCAEQHNEHWWDAELHRLRGDVLLRHSANAAEAEASLLKALEIARAQRARPLELRAALALARWRRENIAAVESALAHFTEGFDMPDVREARALLGR